MPAFDLAQGSVRELNAALHALDDAAAAEPWVVSNPRGSHAIAAGLRVPARVRAASP